MARAKCPHCNWKGDIDEEYIGVEVECPECNDIFLVRKLKKKKVSGTRAKKTQSNRSSKTSEPKKKSSVKVIAGVAVPIIGIVAFCMYAYLWDSHLQGVGVSYVKNLQSKTAVEKDFLLYFRDNLHPQAMSGKRVSRLTNRGKAAASIFPSKGDYLTGMKVTIEEYLNDPSALNTYAWERLNNGNVDYGFKMALKAKKLAEQKYADDSTKAAIWDTVAFAYFKKGDKKNAVKVQTQALKYLKNSSDYSREGADFKARLQKYQR